MRSSPRTTSTRARLGGTAAVLAGLCYGAAGYFHRPGISGYTGALVSVLIVALPALFLGGLLGLHARLPYATQTDFASSAGIVGFVFGCFGAVLGIAGELGLEGTIASALRLPATAIPFFYWALLPFFYWALLLAGLTLMGLAASLTEGLRLLGTVVSISGALGWVSLLTDPDFSGVLVPMRPVHVAFAAAFCLGWVVWGALLMVPRENR
jgi:hypothetical protein